LGGAKKRGFFENRSDFWWGDLIFINFRNFRIRFHPKVIIRKKKEQTRGRKHKNCNINIIKKTTKKTTAQQQLHNLNWT